MEDKPNTKSRITEDDGNESPRLSEPIVEIKPTDREKAQQAFVQVFRDSATQMSADYIALAQQRLELVKKLFGNVAKLDEKIFDAGNFKNMSTKEALFAMAMHLKAIGSLSIPLDEHKRTLQEIYVQVNNLFKEDNNFSALPIDSRKKIQNAVTDIVGKLMNVPTDNELINMPSVDNKDIIDSSAKPRGEHDTK